MEKLVIHGGVELSGSVTISGSKNASLPILAATLLTPEPCTIRRVPDVSDTNYMLQILTSLGAQVERSSGVVRVCAESIHSEAPYEIVRKMRASICAMGPLLARLGKASVSLPGGCVIGDRPIDLHLWGLSELGADVDMEGGNILVEAKEDGLVGREIDLAGKHGSTVLGTDNVMMAATLAKGTTVVDGAATEPEVIDLANFLNGMGAKIDGAGTSRIVIEGVEGLQGTEHRVIPDRIEAGTFLVAGAIAGRDVELVGTGAEHLQSVIGVLERCGCPIEVSDDRIKVSSPDDPRGCNITTEPYPGFPTDMQAQMCAFFAGATGSSVVTENIFPQRFMHVPELNRMGADIELNGSSAVVHGVPTLSGAPVMASDLRASAALVLAGLKASGTTEVNRLYHIDRGYENIDEKLMALGARMKRVKV
ncbi:MAG: UDP-N-acetylglucosamine 1-carboxyvinyltransferase [Verrucomicrobiota bacterium]